MARRTKKFALLVIALVESSPRGRIAEVLDKQLLRCGTSVGANYRAACRAKSLADFIFEMGIVEEEADETLYWMELLVETGLIEKESLKELMEEAHQILAMTVASIKTAKIKMKNQKASARPTSDHSAIRSPQSEIP